MITWEKNTRKISKIKVRFLMMKVILITCKIMLVMVNKLTKMTINMVTLLTLIQIECNECFDEIN